MKGRRKPRTQRRGEKSRGTTIVFVPGEMNPKKYRKEEPKNQPKNREKKQRKQSINPEKTYTEKERKVKKSHKSALLLS